MVSLHDYIRDCDCLITLISLNQSIQNILVNSKESKSINVSTLTPINFTLNSHSLLAISRYYLERTSKFLVDIHHCSGIVKFATVVDCAEDSYQSSIGEELVPLLYYLMGSADQI